MNKKIPISLAIAIAVVAMTITFSVTMTVSMRMFDSTISSVNEKELMYGKIAEMDKSVRDHYYGAIEEQQLYDTIGAGYLAGLGDPYARYYTAAQYAEYLAQRSGRVMGIGVDIIKDATGYPRVLACYSGSPAADAGIAVGSYLLTLDGLDLKALSNEAVRALLQGEEGTVVSVGTASFDFTTQDTVALVRRSYTVPSVTQQRRGDSGYVRIATFNENTPAELEVVLQNLQAAGVQGLVLDVRDNTSADIEDMVRVLDMLCPAGEVGVAVYRDGHTESMGRTTGIRVYQMPLVVVTNGGTGGATELFCVTLRNAAGARIVGSRSAGHGSIQAIFEQTDGSALQFTVALMRPADTASDFNGVGITPDFVIDLTAAEAAVSYDLTLDTDPQLLRAFEMLERAMGGQLPAGDEQPGEEDTAAGDEGQSEAQPESTTPADGESDGGEGSGQPDESTPAA